MNCYRCVVDQNDKYLEFVLVLDGEVQGYTLGEGERLIDASFPRLRAHAGDAGLIDPIWNESEWVEGASTTQIAAWEAEHPAPQEHQSLEDQFEEFMLEQTEFNIDADFRLSMVELGL